MGLRAGTLVLAPLNPPDIGGRQIPRLNTGIDLREMNCLPVQNLRPGELVLGHDGQFHLVVHVSSQRYRGLLIGLRCAGSTSALWLTDDHRVLCLKRTLSYGAQRSWKTIPRDNFRRAQEMRRAMTPAERALWHDLRGGALGAKFRRQHPLGRYVLDFYSWDAGLVVEADGESHFTPEGRAHDALRTEFLVGLGLTELRFTNHEILRQREGVIGTIRYAIASVLPSENHYREWRRADSLRVGDTVFMPQFREVEITALDQATVDESTFDPEVQGAHSIVTAVCTVRDTSPRCRGD